MNNKHSLNYFETLTKSDKKVVELKALYNEALKDEQKTFAEYRQDKRSFNKKQSYFESVQRLGAITDIFDILGIEWEGGEPLQ